MAKPIPPLGYGPQLELWGHVGRAPTRSIANMTIKTIPMTFLISCSLFLSFVPDLMFLLMFDFGLSNS